MKVKMLVSRLIGEKLYKAGEKVDLDKNLAKQLIEQGFAEEVKAKKTKKENEEVDING